MRKGKPLLAVATSSASQWFLFILKALGSQRVHCFMSRGIVLPSGCRGISNFIIVASNEYGKDGSGGSTRIAVVCMVEGW